MSEAGSLWRCKHKCLRRASPCTWAARLGALKEHEDILDAVTCAYIGAYLWRHGPRRATTYGSLPEGSILVPITPEMKGRLKVQAEKA